MTGIDDFLVYLQAERRYSAHTIQAYKNDLNQFRDFCTRQGSDHMELHPKVIRAWIVSRMDGGNSPRTVHRKLTTLRTYCKYLIRMGALASNPMDRILKPKLNKRVPSFVDEGNINQLLEDYSFGEDFKGIRNRLIIDLLYQTGMRRSELLGLHTGAVDPEGMILKVKGKRSRERLIPLNPELVQQINRYLELRREVTDPGQAHLFVTEKGEAAYENMIYRIVRKYLALVTTLEKKSPHVLRHTFATHMLNRGADLNAIKELLGHANLSATQVYTHNTFKKLKSIYNQAHPRA
ncbi:MAG TPA: hypothetical protein ENO20_07865 [Bacteroides sp.]|nr:hypothetical protein [Bacteroides sp.]